MTVFNIPIREVRRNFDNNCTKTLKTGKVLVFCQIRCQIELFWTNYWTKNSCLVERFQHSNPRCLSKNNQNCSKTLKIGNFLSFCHFRGHFGLLWGHFRHSQRNSKISTNTYRTKLNLRELNSMGNALQGEYKLCAWQVL